MSSSGNRILAADSPRGAIIAHWADEHIVEIEEAEIEEAAIEEATTTSPKQSSELVLPGLFDIQVNGFAGVDVMTCDANAFWEMAQKLAQRGVTSFLPTLISQPLDVMIGRLETLAPILDQAPAGAARPIGFHLEGPFLATEKRGAHPANGIHSPSVAVLDRLLDAARDRTILMTLAPEVEGADALIARCLERGVRVSLGHTNASYERARDAAAQGATLCTHFGNAMSPFHHRAPGVAGAVLADPRLELCLIPDGIHVHDGTLAVVAECKGHENVILVSDAIAAAGLPDGDYELAGQHVIVRDGACRNEDGVLAGSSLSLDRGVARWARVTNASPPQLAAVSSTNAARALGLSGIGAIEIGARADFVAFRRNGDDLTLDATWIGGRRIPAETRA